MRASFLSLLFFVIGVCTPVNRLNADVVSDNRLYIEDIVMEPGDTKEVPVLLSNANEVKAVQGNIKLPVGFAFATKGNGRLDVKNLDVRSEDFTLSCAMQEDGSMTFAHYSGDGFAYEGSEGGIFTFKITADQNVQPGNYDIVLSDVVLSINGVGYEIPKSVSKVTIEGNSRPGDDCEVIMSSSQAMFDLVNDVDLYHLDKDLLTSYVLPRIGNGISKEAFFSDYDADVERQYSSNSYILKTYTKNNGYQKDNNPQGQIIYSLNDDGSFKEIKWTLTADEAEVLTQDRQTEAILSKYVRFVGKDLSAPYDNIYLKIEVRLFRAAPQISEITNKDKVSWHSLDGQIFMYQSPTASQAISTNPPYPQDQGYIFSWTFELVSYFDGGVVKASNSTQPVKFYFAPTEFEIQALDGTVYIVTPKRGCHDSYYNKFINRYDTSHSHDYCLSANGCGDESGNNHILNQCTIRYLPDSTSIWQAYHMNVTTIDNPSAWPKCDGVFSNDTLYAIQKDQYYTALEYEPIIIIDKTIFGSKHGRFILLHYYVENKWMDGDFQPSGGKYKMWDDNDNAITFACLNAVGYVTEIERDDIGRMTGVFHHKGNPLNKQLRAYIGVITGTNDRAHAMTDDIAQFATFQSTWVRPINMMMDPFYVEMSDTQNGALIYALDLIKLFDWRGIDDGYMWGDKAIPSYWKVQNWRPRQWLWAYYNVKAIQIDARPSKVHISTNGQNRMQLSSVPNSKISITINESPSLARFPFDLYSFNCHDANTEILEYMDNNKMSFGYVKIKDNGSGLDEYTLFIPIHIEYEWGVISDNLVIKVVSVDGIKSIDNGQLTARPWSLDPSRMDNAAIYNLSGQRLSQPQRGVNIVDGKKVIIK